MYVIDMMVSGQGVYGQASERMWSVYGQQSVPVIVHVLCARMAVGHKY